MTINDMNELSSTQLPIQPTAPSPSRFPWVTFFTTIILSVLIGMAIGRELLPAPSGPVSTINVPSNATGTGQVLGMYQMPTDKNIDLTDVDFRQFWDLWDMLKEKYYEQPVKDKDLFYGAMNGLASSLGDPYTTYFEPKSAESFQAALSGKFEGIGAQLGLKDNKITIIAPLKKSPAEIVGIRAGDVIVKVNDEKVAGWTLTQAVSKIRGPKGTKVKITVDRGGKEKTFEITRDVINTASVEVSFEASKPSETSAGGAAGGEKEKQLTPPDIAYLKLSQFGTNTNDEWDKAIEEITAKWQKKEIKGMILDLRDNPGGYLETAVYLASEFLPKEKIIVKQESSSAAIETRSYQVARTGRLLDIPLVILVNKGSASASEILSGAMRDYKRAKLIGEKTFGKGSVQEDLDLKNNAGLHVTVAKWILPNGDWIMGKGIEPDIKVENKVENGNTLTKDTDAQLKRAIEEVLK